MRGSTIETKEEHENRLEGGDALVTNSDIHLMCCTCSHSFISIVYSVIIVLLNILPHLHPLSTISPSSITRWEKGGRHQFQQQLCRWTCLVRHCSSLSSRQVTLGSVCNSLTPRAVLLCLCGQRYIYIYIYIYMCVCVYVCMYTCVCVCSECLMGV